MPKISVIVPNYNHAPFLEQRLDSIFGQTFQDFEVILLDDCSTDNSVEILSEYAKDAKVSHLIVNKTNSGSTFKQWEKGINLAKGEYIWIAESDDWADKIFLDTHLENFRIINNLGLSYCQSFIVNEKSEIQYINTKYTDCLDKKRWLSNYSSKGIDEIQNYLIFMNTIPNVSAILLKKEKINMPKKIYDYSYMGDWFLYCDTLLNSDIAYVFEPLNYYRTHASNVRNKAIKDGRREKEYFWLLTFLKNQRNVCKNKIKTQVKKNINSWRQKYKSISLKNNIKILLALLRHTF